MRQTEVQEIITKTPEWIHAVGSHESLYLLPADSQTYSYERAYCDWAFLKALGIKTLDAELLFLSDNLAAKAGLAGKQSSTDSHQEAVGWRLPREGADARLLQILPSAWMPHIINREQFLEVLVLDVRFRRAGQREVIFRKTEQGIEAIFIPSDSPVGVRNCIGQQTTYLQRAVYDGLDWARLQPTFKSKLESIRFFQLAQGIASLPQLGVAHRVQTNLWLTFADNQLCFEQAISEVTDAIYGTAGHSKEQKALGWFPIPKCPACIPKARYCLGALGG